MPKPDPRRHSRHTAAAPLPCRSASPACRLALLLAVGLMWLALAAGAAAQDRVVGIGVLAPLTGPDAAAEREILRGVQRAIEEANEAGGIAGYHFELVPGDVKDRSHEAVEAAVRQLLADPRVQVVLSSFASYTNFEIELMAQAGMPYLLAAPPQLTREIIAAAPDSYWCCWSLTPAFEAFGTGLPAFVERLTAQKILSLPSRKVAVIASDNPYSRTIAEGIRRAFAGSGWTVTVDAVVPFGRVEDWRPILSAIRQDPPAVIANTDFIPENAAAFVAQFLEEPTESLLFLQYAPAVPQFLDLAGEQANGILYSQLGGVLDTPQWPRGIDLLRRFDEGTGKRPDAYALALYEMAHLYFDALAAVGDPREREAIGRAIGATDKAIGQGRLRFDPATHLAQQGEDAIPLSIFQIQDRRRVLVSPPGLATGRFVPPPWMPE